MENEIGGDYPQPNLAGSSCSHYPYLEYSKADDFKGEGIMGTAFDACQVFSQNPNAGDEFMPLDLHLPHEALATKQYTEPVSYEEALCPPVNLVGTFQNLALNNNNDIENAAFGEVATGSQLPSTNSSSAIGLSLPPPPPPAASSHEAFSPASYGFSNALSNTALTQESNQRKADFTFRSSLNQAFSNYIRTCKKCASVLVSSKSDPNKLQCVSCAKSKDGRRKRRSRSSSVGHPCVICELSFASWDLLSDHVQKYHSNAEPRDNIFDQHALEKDRKLNLPLYCCGLCSGVSKEFKDFLKHKCRNGENKGVTSRYLISDMALLHRMSKFHCDVCKSELRSLKRIMYHVHRCDGGPFPCRCCALEFDSLTQLNYHKHKSHSDLKCFKCDECGREFMNKSSLRKHCVAKHESKMFQEAMASKDVTTYRCDLCPKKFVKKIYLTNHKIRNHFVDKKFSCSVCGKKLMTKNSLLTHLDMHKGEKKFECKYCDKRFRAKEKVILHQRIHTGERPFECTKCDKMYISQSKLNEHLRKHTYRRLTYKCPMCSTLGHSHEEIFRHMLKVHGSRGIPPRPSESSESSSDGHSESGLVAPAERSVKVSSSQVVESAAGANHLPPDVVLRPVYAQANNSHPNGPEDSMNEQIMYAS